MLKFYFSREKRSFGILLQEPTWFGFFLTFFGLWWLISLPWQILIMLHYEPAAWPVALYNVALFSFIGFIVWRKERPAKVKSDSAEIQ